MAVNLETYNRFYSLTNYKLQDFVVEVGDFFRLEMPLIVGFYLGQKERIDRKHIKKLNRLTEESVKILGIFRDYKNIMSTVDYWELLDGIEDFKSHLQYAQNISKYVRSSLVKGKVTNSYIFNHTMASNETLENVSRDIQKSFDPDNRWADIAVDNDLREVDWDIDGGTELELRDTTFQAGIVTSMIDNTIGDRIYGKDLTKLLKFEDEDLLVLGYKETAIQTVDTLSQLAKNDIPEFPGLGINANIWKGSNFSKLNFPLISREMRLVFNTDDLFKDFKVLEIRYDNGDLFVQYEIGTKRGLVLINNITI